MHSQDSPLEKGEDLILRNSANPNHRIKKTIVETKHEDSTDKEKVTGITVDESGEHIFNPQGASWEIDSRHKWISEEI